MPEAAAPLLEQGQAAALVALDADLADLARRGGGGDQPFPRAGFAELARNLAGAAAAGGMDACGLALDPQLQIRAGIGPAVAAIGQRLGLGRTGSEKQEQRKNGLHDKPRDGVTPAGCDRFRDSAKRESRFPAGNAAESGACARWLVEVSRARGPGCFEKHCIIGHLREIMFFSVFFLLRVFEPGPRYRLTETAAASDGAGKR